MGSVSVLHFTMRLVDAENGRTAAAIINLECERIGGS